MRRWILTAALFLLPAVVQAAPSTIDAALIPDGTYSVQVVMVIDARDAVVKLDNGLKTALRTTNEKIALDKLSPGQTIKVSLVKGVVTALNK